MIKHLSLIDGKMIPNTGTDTLSDQAIWVDILNPTEAEKSIVESILNVELFTPQESEEIESSSKYAETETEIGINLNFLRDDQGNQINEPVSFILKDKCLITQRNYEFKTFTEIHRKILTLHKMTCTDIFLALIETRIDRDADLIESITDEISLISQGMVKNNNVQRSLLLTISSFQESTISIRENIIEKQRILSSILKSRLFPVDNFGTLRVMLKDVESLLDHTSFNFQRLEFLQSTFLGLVDIEQNRIIKIFTLVTVIFMPPTLIASLYGMNFKFMPELELSWGYPLALFLMVFSSVVTIVFFKTKNWL
jgi:magnesium transporter